MNVKVILINFVALFLAIFMVLSFLGGGGNEIGGLLKYLSFGSLLVALYSAKFGFWILILSLGYIDLLKRMLILGNYASFGDVTMLLAFPPLLCVIMFISIVVNDLFRGNIRKPEIRRLINCGLVAIVMSGFAFSSSGGLGLLKNMANFLGYIPLIYIMPKLFPDKLSLVRALKLVCLIYIPIPVYAILQSQVGLAQFEIDYLLTGFSSEIRMLYGQDFRYFSTLNSSQNLSKFASLLWVLILLVPHKFVEENYKLWSKPTKIILVLLFFGGAFVSGARTGIFMGLFAVVAYFVLRSRFLTVFAYIFGFCMVIFVVSISDYVVESKILNTWSSWLYTNQPDWLGYNVNLGTLTIRFEGFSNWKDPDFWRPFGYHFSDIDYRSLFTYHDGFSDLIVRFGYIPLSTAFGIASIFLVSFHKNILRHKKQGKMKFIFSALILSFLFGSLTAITFGTFPIATLLYIFVGGYIISTREEKQERLSVNKHH